MYEYYDEYKRAKTNSDLDAQARWARQLTWEVARHAVGEEIIVYPLMEKHMGDKGKELADEDRSQHQVRTAFMSDYPMSFNVFFLARQGIVASPRISYS